MEEEKLDAVHISAVVRAVKEQGVCMLMDMDEEHYLVTGNFILKLRRRDAWRIQCKLEIEKRNVYCGYTKEAGWVQSNKPADCHAVLEKYLSWVNQAANNWEASPTGVAVILYDGYPMDGRLYYDKDGFTLIRGDYLDMLDNKLSLARAGDMVVVNEAHILSILPDDAWAYNKFICKDKEG